MTVEISLSQGRVALIDNEDAALVLSIGTWRFSHGGYAVHGQWPNVVFMHRLLYANANGPLSVLDEIDHRDMDGLNNQRHNLRIATHAQNGANKRQPKIANRSSSARFKGVRPHGRRWVARITVNYKQFHLGTFDSELAAARAYDAAAYELFGEFARPNLPSSGTAHGRTKRGPKLPE